MSLRNKFVADESVQEAGRSGWRFASGLAGWVLSGLLLTACTTGPYAPPPPVVTPPSQGPAVETPQQQTPSTRQGTSTQTESSRTIARGVRTERTLPSAAAHALIKKAEAARQAGDFGQATSLLERAQRMSPQAAEVYLELARVKLAEGSTTQAEQFGQKALSLSGGDTSFRSRVWQAIAEIREARGDRQGAAKARENARLQG